MIPTHARLTDGRIIALVKDCGCITHDGPHWVQADHEWRLANQKFRDQIKDRGIGAMLASVGLAQEEIARLRTKRYEMQSRGIDQLLDEEDILAIRAAGEMVRG